MNCTAHVRAGPLRGLGRRPRARSGAQAAAAEVAGLPPEKVTVHTTYLGGGFGRRHRARLRRRGGAAVEGGRRARCRWSGRARTTCATTSTARPRYHVLRAGLDAAGAPVAWTHRIVAPGIAHATSARAPTADEPD